MAYFTEEKACHRRFGRRPQTKAMIGFSLWFPVDGLGSLAVEEIRGGAVESRHLGGSEHNE